MIKIKKILKVVLYSVSTYLISQDIYNAVYYPEELTCWDIYILCAWASSAALYYLKEALISLKELKNRVSIKITFEKNE